MKIFINSRNFSLSGLSKLLSETCPEHQFIQSGLQLSISGADLPGPLKITLSDNYIKLGANDQFPIAGPVLDVLNELCTPTRDATGELLLCAEKFRTISDINIELVNDFNATIISNAEIALRLRLWINKKGNSIEIQPFENEGGWALRKFIENGDILTGQVEKFKSGNLVKYIIKPN
ncbi:hypothetical protein [Pedobacter aquatilis]|uniref:hypothetical protein n=1 Tax=Pedobacter aquatilis TaxID=351343 RepID=UPI00292F4BF4|nr:hypothetical protein [Pedobacter aquatilis]